MKARRGRSTFGCVNFHDQPPPSVEGPPRALRALGLIAMVTVVVSTFFTDPEPSFHGDGPLVIVAIGEKLDSAAARSSWAKAIEEHGAVVEIWPIERGELSLRRYSHTLYHPIGTARMGSDADSVVDPELRVRGVDRLRVADASVIPSLIRGHTNAPAIVVGEVAADLIRGL